MTRRKGNVADAYYAGKVIFPEKFNDIDPARKADEIYQFLLGQPLYVAESKTLPPWWSCTTLTWLYGVPVVIEKMRNISVIVPLG
nr:MULTISPECIES: hypothetical protein [Moorella]